MSVTTSTCSLASLRVNEPLAGTAVESVDRWLLLEVTDVWAPKVLQTEALSPQVRDRLAAWTAEGSRARLQLIRRPGRSGKRPLFAVVSSEGRAARVELDRFEDLLDLDLDTVRTDESNPMLLVCVHGRRDRCCAKHGSALYRALHSQVDEVWQTSHLGGHRFAACALSLPDGFMYGRVRPEHSDRMAAALRAREVVDLDLLRGRCSHDRPTQAAEIFARRRTGEVSIDGFDWLGTTDTGPEAWTVRFRSAAGEHSLDVRLEQTGAVRAASCNAEPEAWASFVEA